MYKFFIGCDMSKDWFDMAYFDETKPIYVGKFDNDEIGFVKFLKTIQSITSIPSSKWFICFENTGVYSKKFLQWLDVNGIPCKEENPLKIHHSQGMRRGKSDKSDSLAICTYAFEKRASLVESKPDRPLIIKLKQLVSRRELLVKKKVAIEVSLKEQKNLMEPDILKFLTEQNKQLVGLIKDQIKQVEVLITQVMEQDDQMKTNAKLAQSVIGIGPVITSYVMAFTNNFQSINDARKFCSYIGVAPFKHKQTGKAKGVMRVSHMANKRLKALISNGAISAMINDPGIKKYYHRKIAEGKPVGLVINAIKNKLMHRLFAVIRRQEPYVKLSYV